MRQKTEIEQAKTSMLKAVRSTIRLEHSLAADEHLNRALPEAEAAFDQAVLHGELMDVPKLVDLVRDAISGG